MLNQKGKVSAALAKLGALLRARWSTIAFRRALQKRLPENGIHLRYLKRMLATLPWSHGRAAPQPLGQWEYDSALSLISANHDCLLSSVSVTAGTVFSETARPPRPL